MKTYARELAALSFAFSLSSSYLQAQTVVLSTRYSQSDTCKILYADSSAMVVWRSDEPFIAETDAESAIRLSPADIVSITVVKKSHVIADAATGFLIGAVSGALIGLASGDDNSGFIRFSAGSKALMAGLSLGVIGGLVGGIVGGAQGIDDEFFINRDRERYCRILHNLDEIAMYHPPAPAWLGAVVKQDDAPAFQMPSPAAGEGAAVAEPSINRLHLTLGGGLRLAGSANTDISGAFTKSGFGGTYDGWFGPISYPVDNGTSFYWDIAGDYSVTDNLRLGLRWSSGPTEDVEGKDWESEKTHAESFAFLFTYVPSPVGPLFESNFEISLTGGLSYNLLRVDDRISSISYSAYGQSPSVYHAESDLVGIIGRLGIDYYITRNISFQCTLGAHLIPSVVSMPGVLYTNPYDGSTKTLLAHSVSFSGMDLTTGIRLHF